MPRSVFLCARRLHVHSRPPSSAKRSGKLQRTIGLPLAPRDSSTLSNSCSAEMRAHDPQPGRPAAACKSGLHQP
jgi:hypothetical protein